MKLRIYPKVRDVTTAIGWALLPYHFVTRGFDFRWEGFLLTLLISVISAVLTVSTETIIKYYLNGRRHVLTTKEKKATFAYAAEHRSRWEENPLRELWWNGQEGLYKLPLLYIGITPITIPLYAIFTMFNALARKEWTSFIAGVVATTLVLWIALPYGIAGVLLGYVTIQIVLAMLNRIVLERYERLTPPTPAFLTPKRKARRTR